MYGTFQTPFAKPPKSGFPAWTPYWGSFGNRGTGGNSAAFPPRPPRPPRPPARAPSGAAPRPAPWAGAAAARAAAAAALRSCSHWGGPGQPAGSGAPPPRWAATGTDSKDRPTNMPAAVRMELIGLVKLKILLVFLLEGSTGPRAYTQHH